MKKKQFFVLLLTFLILMSKERLVMAMSADERSELEDNVIEYKEVAELVSNYNITVKNNRRHRLSEYDRFGSRYSKSNWQ